MTRVTFKPYDSDKTVVGNLHGEPIPTGLGGEWEQQSRALRDPLLVYQGRQLVGAVLNIVLEGDVADKVRWLSRFARGAEGDESSVPAKLTINTRGAWDLDSTRRPSWQYVIRDVQPQEDEEFLEYGPEGKTRQLVSVEVSRWQAGQPIFRQNGKPLTDSAAVKGTTKATAKDVKYGLIFVSVRIYGTASRVADLMALNRIRDPKKLRKGQVIKLP